MARHHASYEHPGDDTINEIIGNGGLSEHYLALARDLDVMEAKVIFIISSNIWFEFGTDVCAMKTRHRGAHRSPFAASCWYFVLFQKQRGGSLLSYEMMQVDVPAVARFFILRLSPG